MITVLGEGRFEVGARHLGDLRSGGRSLTAAGKVARISIRGGETAIVNTDELTEGSAGAR